MVLFVKKKEDIPWEVGGDVDHWCPAAYLG